MDSRVVSPKRRLDTQFVDRLNDDADIMAEHLTKSLIDLSGFSLASQGNAKLCFDHVERGFDVAALVIALHESLRVVAIQMKHLFPQSGFVLPSLVSRFMEHHKR